MSVRLCAAILVLLGLSGPFAAAADEPFPTRPINVVAPFPPGGQADLMARPTAAAMEKLLKSPVVVVNKTGAAGAVGMSFVANSKPDGYTLLMALSSISIIPEADKLFDRKPAYTMDQLVPVGLISADPTIFVVRADRPWKSVKEFVEDAKKRPDQISYSSSGIYGTLHMAMEMFSYAAGIQLKHVPYGGAAPALTAILGGHVDALASAPAVVLPVQRGYGRLGLLIRTHFDKTKALASTGLAVHDHFRALHCPVRLEHLVQIGTGDTVAQVPNIQFLAH